jgi:hypothetical protein
MLALKLVWQRGVLEELLHHRVRRSVALDLDDDPHPVLSLSSRMSLTSVIRFAPTSSAIFSMSVVLLTWYGSSVMTTDMRPRAILLEGDLAADDDPPAPVAYMWRMTSTRSFSPVSVLRWSSKRKIVPPVGKSGRARSRTARRPSCRVVDQRDHRRQISVRLCGGMLVAIPTAIPELR